MRVALPLARMDTVILTRGDGVKTHFPQGWMARKSGAHESLCRRRIHRVGGSIMREFWGGGSNSFKDKNGSGVGAMGWHRDEVTIQFRD